MPNKGSYSLQQEQAEAIVAECYGEVLAYCRRHAPAGHEAADLAQEVFLRFTRAKAYRERGKPIAYLMRIARSVCVDASRYRRLETVALDFDVPDPSGEPQGGALEDSIEKLPAEMREAVELRYGAGLGVAEVAKALGVSRFAARRRINAALALLEKDLKEGGTDV